MTDVRTGRSLASKVAVAGSIAMTLIVALFVAFAHMHVIDEGVFRILFVAVIIVESLVVVRMIRAHRGRQREEPTDSTGEIG